MSDETAGTVEPVPFSTALGERYLAYALSTITARSLPDVRDGLKPVHRRLVHAMRELGLDPAAGFKKCARVVGDVMGKYHPHGDAAIYDAMVRLAQEFAVRYPLVEGHGNFGNIDGDNAAAMRYTEARLTAVAEALLEGIDEDAVDFRETYDGEGREPEVLPAAFPNLLANGAQGIAVGMATNIPPHNAGELAAALLHLIRWPTAKDEKIAEHVPGPDFPTGGCLTEDPAAIAEAYRTGRGSLRVRARWEVEKLERGHWRAVVTEISLPGAEGAAAGTARRRHRGAQAAGGRAGDRRVRRGCAHPAGAAQPQHRPGRDDGAGLQALGAGNPLRPQPERAWTPTGGRG